MANCERDLARPAIPLAMRHALNEHFSTCAWILRFSCFSNRFARFCRWSSRRRRGSGSDCPGPWSNRVDVRNSGVGGSRPPAQIGPDVHQVAVLGSVEDHSEALPPLGGTSAACLGSAIVAGPLPGVRPKSKPTSPCSLRSSPSLSSSGSRQKPQRHVDDLDQRPASPRRRKPRQPRRPKLHENLTESTAILPSRQRQATVGAIRPRLVQRGGNEYAGQHGPEETAHAVDAEGVERIIVLEHAA